MKLRANRLIIFTKKIELLCEFYENVLDLKHSTKYRDLPILDAGGIEIMLHNGSPALDSKRPPKLAFYVKDVSKNREWLITREAKLGKVKGKAGELQFCEGKDPDGNPYQLSNRA